MKKEPGKDDEVTCSDGSTEASVKACEDKAVNKAEEDSDAEEMSEAATKRAKDLLEILNPATVDFATSRPSALDDDDPSTNTDLEKAFAAAGKASNGLGKEKMAQAGVMDTKGAMSEVDAPPGSGLTVDSDTAIITAGLDRDVAKYVAGGGFATGSERKTHADEAEVPGSYGGVNGKYICGAVGCASQRGNGGIILVGTWTFEPTVREPKYKGDDQRYAQFGWWLDEAGSDPKAGAWYGFGADGALRTTGNTGTTDAGVTAASGSAIYNGHAIGQAAFYHRLGEEANIGGAFTADAKLTADFDAGNGAGTLKGDITGFNVGGVEVPDWSVELMEQPINTSGGVTIATPSTKWAIDDTAAAASGDWSASFYDIPEGEHQPKGVAGGFVSHYGTDGRMVGAFGAER